MTAFIPTTRVTVQRGVLAADSWGDQRASTTVAASGVPAAVTEGVQRSYQPSGARGGVVEAFTIRLRPGTDVTEDDRLVDERTGAIYQVRSVINPQTVVGIADVRVIAVRAGAASRPENG